VDTFIFTGIITTGSTLAEYYYYVSAYRVLYSDDAQKWTVYREPGIDKDKVKIPSAFWEYSVENLRISSLKFRDDFNDGLGVIIFWTRNLYCQQ